MTKIKEESYQYQNKEGDYTHIDAQNDSSQEFDHTSSNNDMNSNMNHNASNRSMYSNNHYIYNSENNIFAGTWVLDPEAERINSTFVAPTNLSYDGE
jgi:hypothetical protein